jgi:hypothetical protein
MLGYLEKCLKDGTLATSGDGNRTGSEVKDLGGENGLGFTTDRSAQSAARGGCGR